MSRYLRSVVPLVWHLLSVFLPKSLHCLRTPIPCIRDAHLNFVFCYFSLLSNPSFFILLKQETAEAELLLEEKTRTIGRTTRRLSCVSSCRTTALVTVKIVLKRRKSAFLTGVFILNSRYARS